MPEGFYSEYGYYGYVDNQYILFVSEEEYFEYLNERNNENGESN